MKQKAQMYKSYSEQRKTRNGSEKIRPFVHAEDRRITYTTDKQLQYIEELKKDLDSEGIQYQYILNSRNYARSAKEANSVIRQLRGMRQDKGYKAKYYVVCINLTTGERKQFIVPKPQSAPKGWKYYYSVKTVWEKNEERV